MKTESYLKLASLYQNINYLELLAIFFIFSLGTCFQLQRSTEWNRNQRYHISFQSKQVCPEKNLKSILNTRRLWTPLFQQQSDVGPPPENQKGAGLPSVSSLGDSSSKTSPAAEVRRIVSITEVVGKYIELKPSGTSHLGCCPFHNDNTPSMSVSEEKGLYHCFACGESGDVIKFVMGMEQMEWREALEFLVDNYASEVEALMSKKAVSPEQRAKAKARQQHLARVKACVAAAAEFYAQQLALPSAGGARAYLRERELPPRTAAVFGLGLATKPTGKRGVRMLTDHLLGEGFTMDELVDAGLVMANKWKSDYEAKSAEEENGNEPINIKNAMDRFRNRLMIPIRDNQGSVVAFGARALGDNQLPKYLNSPETPIFKKSKLLFGMDLARDTIRAEGLTIIVEGYFDVMALHAKNITNAVGVLGSAMTADSVKVAAGMSKDKMVILNMDGDDAGRNAVLKLCSSEQMQGLCEDGIHVRVAELPEEYKDPASCLEKMDEEQYRQTVLDSAKGWSEWYGDFLLSDFKEGDPELFRRVVMRLTDFLSTLPAADRTFHCYKFAEKLANGNPGLRLQLETDFMQLVKVKEKKHERTNDLSSSPKADSGGSPKEAPILSQLSSGEATIPDEYLKKQRAPANKQSHSNYQENQKENSATGSKTSSKHSGLKKNEGKGAKKHSYKKKKEEAPAYWKPLEDHNQFRGKHITRVLAEAELQLLLLLVHDPANRQVFIEAISDHQLVFTSSDRQWLYDKIMSLSEEQRGASVEELKEILTNLEEGEGEKYFSLESHIAKLFKETELLEAMTKNSEILLQTTLITILKANAEAARKLLLHQFTEVTGKLHQGEKAFSTGDSGSEKDILASQLRTDQTSIIEKVAAQTEIINDFDQKLKHFSERMFSIEHEQQMAKHMAELVKLQTTPWGDSDDNEDGDKSACRSSAEESFGPTDPLMGENEQPSSKNHFSDHVLEPITVSVDDDDDGTLNALSDDDHSAYRSTGESSDYTDPLMGENEQDHVLKPFDCSTTESLNDDVDTSDLRSGDDIDVSLKSKIMKSSNNNKLADILLEQSGSHDEHLSKTTLAKEDVSFQQSELTISNMSDDCSIESSSLLPSVQKLELIGNHTENSEEEQYFEQTTNEMVVDLDDDFLEHLDEEDGSFEFTDLNF